jgi:NAD(P)-dependent dehydrogenase (short-subunit alcohol dehydrogenase family)
MTAHSVIISGASSGIGAALARHFLSAGHLVFGIDLVDPVADLAAADGYWHRAADITDEASLDAAFAAAWSSGPVGAVIGSAAVTDIAHRLAIELDYTTWRRILDTNVDGAFLTGRLAARRMIPQGFGNIVFITSSLGRLDEARANDAPYCTSKAAVEMLSKVLAKELAGTGVNVNTLYPLVRIDTGFFAHLPEAERRELARPDILNLSAAFLAGRPPGSLTGESVDQDRFDRDTAYRRSLGERPEDWQ